MRLFSMNINNMNDISKQLTDFFEAHLPIAQFMQMEVDAYTGDELVLSAPLEPNINDKQTAFGGSLYNLAVMSCWGMLYLQTQEKGIACNQVVSKGGIRYLAPVTGKLTCVCKKPSDETLADFFAQFEKKGRARIALESSIECNGVTAVVFEGEYAILKPLD
jgi:thioesterase domain-containing protein